MSIFMLITYALSAVPIGPSHNYRPYQPFSSSMWDLKKFHLMSVHVHVCKICAAVHVACKLIPQARLQTHEKGRRIRLKTIALRMSMLIVTG